MNQNRNETGRIMDCSSFQEISGLRDSDLTPDERLARDEHLRSCPTCQKETEQDLAVLALFHELPVYDSNLTAHEVRKRAGEKEAPEPQRDAEPGVAEHGAEVIQLRNWRGVGIAVAAMLIVGFVIARPGVETPSPVYDGVKSAQHAETAPQIWLSLAAERADGEAEAVPDNALYRDGRGFLPRVEVGSRGGYLALVALNPDGSFETLRGGNQHPWTVAEGERAVLEQSGRLLAWTPDHEGQTTLYAILLDSPRAVDSELVSGLRAGTAAAEPGVLAVDMRQVRRVR